MNLERLAALVVRIFALGFFTGGIFNFTYLPRYFWDVQIATIRHGYVAHYQLEAQLAMLRIIADFIFGTTFFVGWRRVVKVLIKDVPMPREQQ